MSAPMNDPPKDDALSDVEMDTLAADEESCPDPETDNNRTQENSNRDDEDWSLLDENQSVAPSEDFSLVTPSVISGFEMLSLPDPCSDPQGRTCLFCQGINTQTAESCMFCNATFATKNPFFDADEQLALALQREEEGGRGNFNVSECEVNTEVFALGSQVLAAQITDYLGNLKNPYGFTQVPRDDLAEQANLFLRCYARHPCSVTLAFTYCTKMGSGMYRVFNKGFESNGQVTQQKKVVARSFPRSFFIGGTEHGWIVAVFQRGVQETDTSTALLEDPMIIPDDMFCLPLVCFEGSLIQYKFIDRIRIQLIKVCRDFLRATWPSICNYAPYPTMTATG